MMVIQKNEFDQKVSHSHTTDQPRTLRKIHRSKTATQQQEYSESDVSSSLFFSEMLAKLKTTTVNLVLVRTVKNNYFSLCTN